MDNVSAAICSTMDEYEDSQEHGKGPGGRGGYIMVDGAWYIGNFLPSPVSIFGVSAVKRVSTWEFASYEICLYIVRRPPFVQIISLACRNTSQALLGFSFRVACTDPERERHGYRASKSILRSVIAKKAQAYIQD